MTQPHFNTTNMTSLSLLDNASSMLLSEPKTPSPLPKSKVLDVADELLSRAEKEFASLESKRSMPLLSSRSSARNTNGSISTKGTMTDLQVSPTKSSLIYESKLKNRPRSSNRVPQNSPCSIKSKEEENYYHNNGEKKVVKPKPCPHQRQLKSVSYQSNQSKPKSQESDVSENELPAVSQLSMFYEQQQSVERSSQKVKENSSTTVVFTTDAKIISSTNLVQKQDVQTSTEPEISCQSRNLQRFTPNSSIISMKTSKPEEDVELETGSQKLFNVQKMPSVNIRPEFTVQHGPKINIVSSNSVSYKPKRRNTEYFNVVYPPRNSMLTTENKFVSDNNKRQYVCDRHNFPSGVLIPSSQNGVCRDNPDEGNYGFDDKKSLLISLIKLLMEKIEKQASKERKSCCRLVCSLPLLASKVSKIEVDCVNCLDLLYKQMDRLVLLMKEELRSQRDISKDHCCMLDETVQYHIVELELMQDENSTRRCHPDTLRTFKHQDKEEINQAPKKTVSFESLPSAPEQTTSSKNCPVIENSLSFRCNVSKNENPKIFDPKAKNPSSSSEKPRSTDYRKKLVDQKLTNKVYKQQIENKISSVGQKPDKPFKNPSSFAERTVVGQVVKGLTTKKSILKNDSAPQKQPMQKSNDNKKNLNAVFEVVNDRETSREFDFWIKERSLKIKKIHDELNKIVEGSSENHEQVTEYDWLERPIISDDNATQEVDLSSNQTINSSQNDEVEEPVHENAESTSHEVVQDYAEDFEEDDEDFSNGSNSEDSGPQTKAEAENGSSSPGSQEILTDEERVEDTSDKSRSVDDKLTSQSLIKAASLSKRSQDEQSVQSTEEKSLKKIALSNVIKVDIATSPIDFESSENISHNTKLPIPNKDKTPTKTKTSIALSPINVQIANAPTSLSSSAQTEITGSQFFVDNRGDIQVNDSRNNELNLLPPSSKLVLTPRENVLKLSLGTSEENSLSLQTKSFNQTMNLTVQLPNLSGQNKDNKQILELEDISEELIEKEPLASQKHDLTTKVERNLNSSMKDNRPSTSKYEYKHVDPPTCLHTLCDKTVKDIIEPTVSEVLKQIHDTKFTSSSTHHLDEIDNEVTTKASKHSELIKPNIFLQTKHNVRNKCQDYPHNNFIDLGYHKQTIDSSNQTEVEKQNVHVQVAASLVGCVSDKGVSARKHDNVTGDFVATSYLTMMQPYPSETLMSSVSCSSTHHSSSGSSSSSTSSSSKSKGDVTVQMETLSEGEVIARCCFCKAGDVCTICVPRLDLSFGELKTKRKHNKTETTSSNNSDSDCSLKIHDPRALLNMPLHLEPRPPSFIPASVLGMKKSSTLEVGILPKKPEPKEHSKYFSNLNVHSNLTSKGHFNVSKNFTEVANSVMTELNEEYLKSNMAYSKDKCVFAKPVRSVNTAYKSDQAGFHSSSDSQKSARDLYKSKKSSPGRKSKFKTSLVIKSPLETPRIDMVIENSEADSLSSYQTSVTSVSVDNLQASLTSHSSGELYHHLKPTS